MPSRPGVQHGGTLGAWLAQPCRTGTPLPNRQMEMVRG